MRASNRTWTVVGGGCLALVLWAIWPTLDHRDGARSLEVRPSPDRSATVLPLPAAGVPGVSTSGPASNPIPVEPFESEELIRGRVRFASGQAVDRAVRVGAWPSTVVGSGATTGSVGGMGEPISSAWTDAEGRFVLPHLDPEEAYTVLAAGEGLQCAPVNRVRSGGEEITVEARALYGARLRFLDPSGAPIERPIPSRGVGFSWKSDAPVQGGGVHPVSRALLGLSSTDLPSYREAYYASPSATGLPSVIYASSASGRRELEGFSFSTGLAGYERVEAEVDLPRVSIPLKVIDVPLVSTGEPLGGLDVYVDGEWSSADHRPHRLPQLWFWSDSGDWFMFPWLDLGSRHLRIEGLPHGVYQVEVRLPQGASYHRHGFPVDMERGTLEIPLLERGGLDVSLTTPNGRIYGGPASLTLLNRWEGRMRVAVDNTVFEHGPYRLLYQEPGEYLLEAVVPGGALVGSRRVTIRPGLRPPVGLQLEAP